MKKIRKHSFVHRDPEAAAAQEKKEVKTESIIPQSKSLTLSPIKKDLIRTAVSITVFIIIIALIYLVQTKTQILNPILRLFGL